LSAKENAVGTGFNPFNKSVTSSNGFSQNLKDYTQSLLFGEAMSLDSIGMGFSPFNKSVTSSNGFS